MAVILNGFKRLVFTFKVVKNTKYAIDVFKTKKITIIFENKTVI